MENQNTFHRAAPHSIRTFTGKFFDFTVMDPDTICIEDIAHALAREVRFTGHTPEAYTVGQHSLMACFLAPDGYKLDALLHDATEAYMKDIAKPLKTLLPDYQALENKLTNVIANKFRLGKMRSTTELVKEIDYRLLENEYTALFYEPGAVDAAGYLMQGDAGRIEKMFLEQYEKYKRV